MTFDSVKPVIVLVGRSGVGKSTYGPLLADALGYGFFDLDQEIAEISMDNICTVSTRRALISGLSRCSNAVIAAGFEDFSDEVMTQDIKDRVFSVWLKAETKGRMGMTRRIYTSFYSLSVSEQDKLFSFANITVSLGMLEIQQGADHLIESVKAALPQIN